MKFLYSYSHLPQGKRIAERRIMSRFTRGIVRVAIITALWQLMPEVVIVAQNRSLPPSSGSRVTTGRTLSPALPRASTARTGTSSLRATEEEAVRLLKLGNTYREARNYDLAQQYINQGLELATRSGSRYWQATGYEYLGLTYRDMGDRTAAMASLQRASDIFSEIISTRSGRSSRNSTQMLLDNMMRDDASRLQPMPLPPSPSNTQRTPLPSSTIPPSQRGSAARSPLGGANSLEAERELNEQLKARLASLESRMRSLDDAANPSLRPSPGPGTITETPTPRTHVAPPASTNPPGAIARTMPMRINGDKPQGEFAPFQTDKKPVPVQSKPVQTTQKKDTAQSLPVFTLQIGAGTGYALNRPVMIVPPVAPQTIPSELTGGAPDFSFPLLSISGDFFFSPQFSLGLMYAYYPGPNVTVIREFSTGTLVTTTSTMVYTDYHFLTLRPSFHFVRNQNVDAYLGLSLGSMLNFQPLRLYAGLMAGFQYNFTRWFGVFLELSGGGHFTGTTAVDANPIDPGTIVQLDQGIINIGAYGRIGLAFNF